MLQNFFFGRHVDDEETILLVVHKHWLLGMRTLLLPSIIFIAISCIVYVARTKAMLYGISLAEAGVSIWWIRNFFDYYLDAWIITNKGVIDLEWHGWFHRSSARVLYSDIQGVGYEVKGMWGTLLRYGTVQLEKISNGSTISMQFVKNPRKVEVTILEAMEAYLLKKNLKDASTVQGILAEFVASSLQKQHVEGVSKSKGIIKK